MFFEQINTNHSFVIPIGVVGVRMVRKVCVCVCAPKFIVMQCGWELLANAMKIEKEHQRLCHKFVFKMKTDR